MATLGRSVRKIVFTGALAIGATGLMAAPMDDDWFDQWHRTKFGRSSPRMEARQKAERAATAFREEAPGRAVTPTADWTEQHFKMKFGRSSPVVEAREKAERAATAFREEAPGRAATPAADWTEQHFKMKFGRSSPVVEARQKAGRR